AVGDGGDITITTGSLSITGGAALNALTQGQGNGGNVTINAREQVLIDGKNSNGGASGVFSSVDVNAYTDQPPARGDGGDITISTGSLSITTGAGLFANTKGEGNGGNVIINARDRVLIDGENSNGGASGIFSSVDSNEYTQRSPARGDGGDITISTGSLSITTGAGLFALTKGQGNGGNVIINARDTVLIDGENSNGGASGVFSSVESNANTDQPPARGNAGDITITTNSLSVTNGGGLYALTAGQGNAGKVTIDARDRISFNGVNSNGGSSGVFSRVDTTGVGQGGDITITTGLLLVTGSAQLNTLTAGQGNAGNLSVTAPQAVILSDNSQLSVETRGVGQAGDVTVTTETLDIKDGTRISATATNTATPSARGGSINVNASTVNFSGQMNGLLAETEGVAPAGALTLQPFANGQDLTINLQDNAKISAATSGSGEGGSLSVTAPEAITIRGQGQLSVETTGDGAAGNLTLDTQNLTITDGATISASTASPNPQGLGGNLTINASESFILTNQARILAQSKGAAPAGTITVDSGQLTANNGSIETSATQSAGGAITITAADIRLFGDSDIRTDVASGVGGGGNITLTADTILAFADSDILAFAQDGKGGDITFNTPVFFGFAYAPAPKGTDPDTLDHNGRVDINATGAVEGVITLPDTSAVRNSLTPLSNNQIDTDKLIAESCIARRHEPKRGSFFITGTGGIPFRPGDLYVTPYQTGTVRSIPREGAGEESSSTRRPWKIGDPIIEPTGIYRLANGELIMGRLCGE
ncbi:MAG: beta strand repeat-containing protein, partial [Coleofasciculus sp.]|uniref:beta strand repeat-containing protein n=1 Tax=Coleofasciculus sp. TaxID=3100458 RepID=UPI003A4090EE